MSMPLDALEGHDVVIVEDDPEAAKLLAHVVRSRGDRPRVATNVEEAFALFREREPCYALIDQQLPADADSPTMIGGGARVMQAARAVNGERNANGWWVMPLIVLTAYANDPDFVGKMYDLGAGAFVEKPLGEKQIEYLLARIALLLERAGRVGHAQCAGCVGARARAGASAPSLAPAPPLAHAPALAHPRLFIAGEREGARSVIIVSGVRCPLQDAVFLILLRLVAAHVRSAGSWSTREVLGIGNSRSATNRVRAPFKGLVPKGYKLIEGDGRGSFRLNPGIVVEGVEWEALVEHPHEAVKKIAREWRGRGR